MDRDPDIGNFDLVPFFNEFNNIFNEDSPLMKAIQTKDFGSLIELVKNNSDILNIVDERGNTPLHIAAKVKNLQILKFIHKEKPTLINVRNNLEETPLFVAIQFRNNNSCVRYLINAGADLNIPNNKKTAPIHYAARSGRYLYNLVTHGADLDVCDIKGHTALHYAVIQANLLAVNMLLYYSADPNILSDRGYTPFMLALVIRQVNIQELLLDYVVDFDVYNAEGFSILELALAFRSPFVSAIIERDETTRINIKALCNPLRPNILKLVWNRVYSDDNSTLDINRLIDISTMQFDELEECVNIMYENPNRDFEIEISPNFLTQFITFHVMNQLELDLLTKMTCLLLEHSYVMKTVEINTIYCNYGHCELIRILMYMPYTEHWTSTNLTTKLIFDIHNNGLGLTPRRYRNRFDLLQTHREIFEDALNYLEFCVNDEFLQKVLRKAPAFRVHENYPKLPSLLQLARDSSREYLLRKYRILTNCQYYTIIDNLNIPLHCKKVLKFERKLYRIAAEGQTREVDFEVQVPIDY